MASGSNSQPFLSSHLCNRILRGIDSVLQRLSRSTRCPIHGGLRGTHDGVNSSRHHGRLGPRSIDLRDVPADEWSSGTIQTCRRRLNGGTRAGIQALMERGWQRSPRWMGEYTISSRASNPVAARRAGLGTLVPWMSEDAVRPRAVRSKATHDALRSSRSNGFGFSFSRTGMDLNALRVLAVLPVRANFVAKHESSLHTGSRRRMSVGTRQIRAFQAELAQDSFRGGADSWRCCGCLYRLCSWRGRCRDCRWSGQYRRWCRY